MNNLNAAQTDYRGTIAEPVQPELDMITNELNSLAENLAGTAKSLGMSRERLFGPYPVSNEAGDPAANGSALDRLQGAIAAIRRRSNEVAEHASVLGRL